MKWEHLNENENQNEKPRVKILGCKFEMGQIVATRGVAEFCDEKKIVLWPFLVRHSQCDWGDLPKSDIKANEQALKEDLRLMSVYYLPDKNKTKIWIITEADRSVTTILFPSEY